VSGVDFRAFWVINGALEGYEKIIELLKEYELDEDVLEKLTEQEREWFEPKIMQASEAAVNGEWGPIHAVLSILSRFAKGECRMDEYLS